MLVPIATSDRILPQKPCGTITAMTERAWHVKGSFCLTFNITSLCVAHQFRKICISEQTNKQTTAR